MSVRICAHVYEQTCVYEKVSLSAVGYEIKGSAWWPACGFNKVRMRRFVCFGVFI